MPYEASINPYNMYYGNSSGSWKNKGVAFIDSSSPGSALGVAYLVTKDQLQELQYFEGRNWYNQFLYLDPIEGYGAVTLTSSTLKPINEPSESYKQMIFDGIKENYKDLSKEDIMTYIESRNAHIQSKY